MLTTYNILCIIYYMFGGRIRDQRKSMQLSQTELARLSGVSVPMIQLIESEKANPSIRTLVMILDSLHMKLECKEQEFNWDRFAHHTGLLYQKNDSRKAQATSQTLVNVLEDAAEVLSVEKDERKRECYESTLLALRLYFPVFYTELLDRSSLIKKLSHFSIEGRHIKLKRIVLDRLKDYL